MIILEGPDNTGKTTLKNKLVEDLYLRPSKYKFNPHGKTVEEVKENVRWYYTTLYHHLRDNSCIQLKKEIWDRCFFSELVYGPVVRGEVYINPIHLATLPVLLYEKNPLIIYCNRPYEEIIKSYEEREQYVEKYRAKQIYDGYILLMDMLKKNKWMVIEYDYGYSYDMIKEAVMEYILY